MLPSPSGWKVALSEDERSAVSGASQRLTTWVLSWGNRRAGVVVLVLLTLVEATIFPAPTEAMLLALCVGQPKRTWWFAAFAAVGSLAGGLIGYHIGAWTFAEIGLPLMHWLGDSDRLPAVEAAYRANAWLALVTSGYTPVPYMLYTMAAGAFSVPLETFAAGSFVGRALKYLPIAALAWYLGPAVQRVASRYAARAGLLVTAVLLAWVLSRVF